MHSVQICTKILARDVRTTNGYPDDLPASRVANSPRCKWLHRHSPLLYTGSPPIYKGREAARLEDRQGRILPGNLAIYLGCQAWT